VKAPHGALAALLAVLGGVLASGCRSLDSSSYNLRELHEEDGAPRPYNAVMSPAEYLLSSVASGFAGFARLGGEAIGVEGSGAGGASTEAREPTTYVEAPRRRAIEELLALESFDTREPEVWAVQAELGVWLAQRSTQPVERLVAVRMLAAVAAELGDVRPSSAGPVLERATGAAETGAAETGAGATADGAPDTGAALAALWRELESAAKAENGAAIRKALAPWIPAEQGLDATRRLVRMTALLARRTEAGGARKLLVEAARGYGRQACALGLEFALEDPAPDVAQLAATTCTVLEPRRAFGLAAAASEGGRFDVVEGVIRGLLAVGLPEGQEDGAARDAWLELFLMHASIDLGTLPGACFGALAAFAPTDLDTLRIEEWRQWFEARRAADLGVDGSESDPSAAATGAPR
jgi:hypothetical protein